MEPIKITDMLTLRQEALRLAVYYMRDTDTGEDGAIDFAKLFESYLKGNAVLPEYVDTSKMFTDVMEKMNDRWNPSSQWISVDSEMKPSDGVEVLCFLDYGTHQEKEMLYYSRTKEEWHQGYDIKDTNVVKAWMPIPEYRPL